MRILLWLLALFALAVGVSLAFGYNEGYVLVVLPPWRIELSLNLFIVLVAGALLGLLVPTLWVLATLTMITVGQRVLHVRRVMRSAGR